MALIYHSGNNQKLIRAGILDPVVALSQVKINVKAKVKVFKTDQKFHFVVKQKGLKFKIKNIDTNEYLCEYDIQQLVNRDGVCAFGSFPGLCFTADGAGSCADVRGRCFARINPVGEFVARGGIVLLHYGFAALGAAVEEIAVLGAGGLRGLHADYMVARGECLNEKVAVFIPGSVIPLPVQIILPIASNI